MSTKNKPSYLRKTAVILAVAISISALFAHAVLFNVTLTDIVSILDDASLRQTAKDSLLPNDNAYPNNQNTADNILPNDNAYPNNQNAADSLLPNDNAYPNNQNTADSTGLSDSVQPSNQATDVVALTAFASRNFFVLATDSIALTDQPGSEVEAPGPPDPPETDEGRNRGGSGGSRTVYDESYFIKNPLQRMQVRSSNIVNEDGSVVARVMAGQSVSISNTIANSQTSDQAYVRIIQITDQNGYAIQILVHSGLLKSGNTDKIQEPWLAEVRGQHKMTIMIWDNLESPTLLSEPVTKEVYVE